MGGQNVLCDFGGGGGRTIECALQNQFGGLRKWDWSGLCPFPLRKMTGREQMGGNRIIGEGPNRFWGRGFMVCSPPPEFSTPLCFSLILRTIP